MEIKRKDIFSNKRNRPIALARQMIFWFLYQYSGISKSEIGKMMARDHGTVIHGLRTIKNLADTDSMIKESMHQIEMKIQ